MARCQIFTLTPVLAFGMAMSFSMPSMATEKQGKAATAKPSAQKAYRPQRGEASYYGKEFYGRKMADGTRMNPQSNIAASRSLPLGTKAEVTNLENGKSEIVEIRDRGPYVDGRIVDLTPKTAEKLGFIEDGVAPVVVEPIDIPKSGSSSR
jgi:rare lipoprotein A